GDLEGWTVYPSGLDAVTEYRRTSPLVVGLWEKLEEDMRRSVGRDHVVTLPNGHCLRYFDVEEQPGNRHKTDLVAWVVKESVNPKHRSHLYGGKLLENMVQRIARDVLADMIQRIVAAPGIVFRWSVDDEIIAEVPEKHAQELHQEHLRIMSTP